LSEHYFPAVLKTQLKIPIRFAQARNGALVLESKFGNSSATLQLLSGSNREGFWHSKIRHPIQDVAGDHRLGFLSLWMPRAKSRTNDCLVPKVSVLDSGLVIVSRLLLPLASPDLLHSHDRTVAST
jgi:hypothetical protein